MGCNSSFPKMRAYTDQPAQQKRPHASSQGSNSAIVNVATHISDAITNFNPISSLFHKRLAVVTEEVRLLERIPNPVNWDLNPTA